LHHAGLPSIFFQGDFIVFDVITINIRQIDIIGPGAPFLLGLDDAVDSSCREFRYVRGDP
jgi:hypothetical protein